MLWVPQALGQSLTATADDSALWVLLPEPHRPGVFTVYHHVLGGPPSHISEVKTLHGQVRPHCVATRDHSLWIIYPDGAVQAIHAEPSLLQDGWVYRPGVEPRLPSGASVRAMALTQTGPWVLVRIEDPQSLSVVDALSQPADKNTRDATARRQRNLTLGLPPRHGISDQDKPQPPAPQPAPGSAPGSESSKVSLPDRVDRVDQVDSPAVVQATEISLPVDRLLYLEHGSWRTYPLPQDWPHGAEAWLVAESDPSQRPTLIARAKINQAQGSEAINVYHADAPGPNELSEEQPNEQPSAWSAQTYPLPNTDAAGITLLAVEDQLVLVRHDYQRRQLSATLGVLRDGKVLPVGTMSLGDVSPTQWSVLGTGNAAALIAQKLGRDSAEPDPRGYLPMRWTQLDVRGKAVLKPTDITLKVRNWMDDLAQYIMLAFVVILITVLMLAFWRRDSAWNKLDLPPDVMVADLPRRAAAAAIDMAPGLFGAMVYYGLSLEDLMLRWPGNGVAHTAEQMLPGAVVIAVFVIHTTLTEFFLAKTIGKIITGLRTATLTGTRPRRRQILVRGLLKTLDLLPWAWLLLLLPVIAPHRQRLGDLVGRTIVVCDVPPEVSGEDSDDSTDESPD